MADFKSTSGDIHRFETSYTQPETTPVHPARKISKPIEQAPSKITPIATTSEETPSPTPSVSPEASAPLALPGAAHTEPPKTTNDSPHLTPPSLTEQPNNVLERDNDIGGAALGHIRAMIEKAITYPSIARKLRLEGTVLVSFILKSDGTVDTAKVVSTSGSRVLDTRAIDTILSLSGDYPSLDKTVELSIPIAFNLKKV